MARPYTPDTLADRWDCSPVATPARSTAWPPAERQTAPDGSMGLTEVVKPAAQKYLWADALSRLRSCGQDGINNT